MALHSIKNVFQYLLVVGLLTGHVLAGVSGGAGDLTTLANFAGANGAVPYARLLIGMEGNFYGTTFQGGTNGFPQGFGTIFKLSPAGSLTTLVFLNSNNGAKPYGGLVQTADGNLYGTTSQGGVSNVGTLFRVSTNGAFTSLMSFTQGNGAQPSARLTLGRDGLLYGTTQLGGTSNQGTVFRTTTNGTLTTLASFSVTNGANPYAEVIQGMDGDFYGTTVDGGAADSGTVFRINTNGLLTTLFSFGISNGAKPYAGLVQHPSGPLYGATAYGGANGYGSIYRITTNGALTTLYSFTNSDDGANPWGSLLLGADGSFYGTAILGGANTGVPRGTVFQFTTNGSFAPLVSFEFGTNGVSPYASLVQDTVGDLFGTTYSGGSGLRGTVFRLTPAPGNIQATLRSGNVFRLTWDSWLGKAYQVQYKTNATQVGWIDLGNPFVASNSPVNFDSVTAGPSRFYRVRLNLSP